MRMQLGAQVKGTEGILCLLKTGILNVSRGWIMTEFKLEWAREESEEN